MHREESKYIPVSVRYFYSRIHALMRILEGFEVQPRDEFTEASLSADRSILEPRGRALTVL